MHFTYSTWSVLPSLAQYSRCSTISQSCQAILKGQAGVNNSWSLHIFNMPVSDQGANIYVLMTCQTTFFICNFSLTPFESIIVVTLENDDNDECGTCPCGMLWPFLCLKMSSKLWVPIFTSLSRSKREKIIIMWTLNYLFLEMACQSIPLSSYKFTNRVTMELESWMKVTWLGCDPSTLAHSNLAVYLYGTPELGTLSTWLADKWFFASQMIPTRELKKEGMFRSQLAAWWQTFQRRITWWTGPKNIHAKKSTVQNITKKKIIFWQKLVEHSYRDVHKNCVSRCGKVGTGYTVVWTYNHIC